MLEVFIEETIQGAAILDGTVGAGPSSGVRFGEDDRRTRGVLTRTGFRNIDFDPESALG